MNRLDYTPFDLPQITHYMFYPHPDSSPPPTGALDHTFPSHDGVQLCGRFFPEDKQRPTILFFHGNGEVAPEYDAISSLYNHIGLNLFVADYRGYGKCQGEPSVSALVEDSHTALAALETFLSESGYAPSIYVMGRSLGAYCAVEIAAGAREKIKGMIIESGSANVGGMPQRLGIAETPVISQLLHDHWARVQSINTPLLIIHGDRDFLVPISHPQDLFEAVASTDKTFFTIPGAGHNDIMLVDTESYFRAIRDFIRRREEAVT